MMVLLKLLLLLFLMKVLMKLLARQLLLARCLVLEHTVGAYALRC